jgi:YHS domain-containing protein
MKPFLILLWASALALTGCAINDRDTASNAVPAATCQVCRYNNDLACIRVRVKDSTPRADYQGQTYFFCSESCREAFLKKPTKYLPK